MMSDEKDSLLQQSFNTTPNNTTKEEYIPTFWSFNIYNFALGELGSSTWLFVIVWPLLFIAGVVGNALAVFLMLYVRKLRAMTHSKFILALSISDTLALIPRCLIWINLVARGNGYDPVVTMLDPSCQFAIVLFTMVDKTSSWLLVCISVERFVVVCFPLRGMEICSKKSAPLIAILITVIFCFCTTIYIVSITDYHQDRGCTFPSGKIWYNIVIEQTLIAYLPCALILTSNVAVIAILRKRFGEFRGHISHVMRTLLAVTFCFVVFIFIHCICFELVPEFLDDPGHDLRTVGGKHILTGAIYCVNFYIYVITWPEVRHILRSFVTKKFDELRSAGVSITPEHSLREEPAKKHVEILSIIVKK